jgi:hypothetical protein
MAPNNTNDEAAPLLEKVEAPTRTLYGSGAQQGDQLFNVASSAYLFLPDGSTHSGKEQALFMDKCCDD